MEPLTRVVTTNSVDVQELADIAARTFPLACPASMAPANIAAFVAAHLSPDRFAEYLSDPQRAVLTAADGDRIIGYAMLIRDGDAAELSKIYVAPEHHGSGVATALMDLALATAGEWGVRRVWLGVNQANQRAQRFYAKNGFTVSGTRTFQVGAGRENDFVMTRALR
ncbi:GNAT family N-acetyltransferase [Mycobacterium sp. E2238]|uniref:GNAT family N-acetyltransferase n=1 Tax=Mycobacterium sp. E2238 TaxID=1834131 RepID=UPI0007FE4B4F|nr:GNAT family N-acetyltransferase [Mycobacterium sp. E2238]OBI26514.1 acetyltransferase [Mycobacterium sp. E2238]